MKVGAGTLTTAFLVGVLAAGIVTLSGQEAVTVEQVTPAVTPVQTTTTAPPAATVAPQAVLTAVPPAETTTSPVQAPQEREPEKEMTVSNQEPRPPAEQPARQQADPGQGGSQQWTDVKTIAPDTVTAKGYGAPAPTLPPVPQQPDPPAYTGP